MAVTPDPVRDRIRSLLSAQLNRDMAPDDDLPLRLDSMAQLELLVAIEKDFALQVDERQLDTPEHFRTVASIARFVCRALQSQGT